MKKFKVLATVALLFGFCSSAFAQATTAAEKIQTPYSYVGLTSEIDDYMDVNSFSDVEFDKFFAFMDYDLATSFRAGVATNFGSVYTGFFFSGDFFGFTNNSSNTTTNYTDADGNDYTVITKTSGSLTDDTNQFQFSTLIGVAGFGIRPTLIYKPGATNTSTKTVTKNSLTDDNANNYTDVTNTENYKIYPSVAVGFNPSVGDFELSPHAYFGIDFNPSKTKTTRDGTLSGAAVTGEYIDINNENWYAFGLGSGLDLPSDDSIVSTSFGLDADFEFGTIKVSGKNYYKAGDTITVNDSYSTETHGRSNITVTPSWSSTITPSDKLSLEFSAAIPVIWNNTNDETITTTTSVTTDTTTTTVVYNSTTPQKEVKTGIAPELGFSVSYKPVEILTLGAEIGMNLPAFQIDSVTTNTYDTLSADRKLLSTDKTTTSSFEVPANDFQLDISSGFKLEFAETFGLDCSWNILGDLVDGTLRQNSLVGQSFWDGMGMIFYHTLDIQIYVKL